MTKYVNNEHFKITGDRKVTVTVELAVNRDADDTVILRNARDYLEYFTNSGNHKSGGFSIGIK